MTMIMMTTSNPCHSMKHTTNASYCGQTAAVLLCAGWPLPPAQEPWCSICPAGWASSSVDAKACSMCMPGYYAENPDSPACLPCPEGTYSSSWGSSQCSHCITGTYSPSEVQNTHSQSVQSRACQTAQLHCETHCICLIT